MSAPDTGGPALPDTASFLSSNFHLSAAAEQALLAHWMAGVDRGMPEYHKKECLKYLTAAALALGFELVERAEGKDMRAP